MADVLFYEDSIIFDPDDPDFDTSALHPDYEDKDSDGDCPHKNEKDSVSRHSFTTDCLPTMSYGMIDSTAFASYPSNSWLLRGESVESLDYSRLNAMDCRVDPNYHGHVNETSMSIEDIRSHFNSCNSCGVSWSDNHVSLDCSECGGYSLKRPCPLCDGKCKAIWTRDVSMSHSVGKAHWDGECRLPQEESQSSIPSFLAEDVLIQGIQELSASS